MTTLTFKNETKKLEHDNSNLIAKKALRFIQGALIDSSVIKDVLFFKKKLYELSVVDAHIEIVNGSITIKIFDMVFLTVTRDDQLYFINKDESYPVNRSNTVLDYGLFLELFYNLAR